MKSETEPHGIAGLWHSWKAFAEDLHGVEWAILTINLLAPSVITWMTGGLSIEDSLKLTLPLTLAVMLIVVSILTKALHDVEHPLFAYCALAAVALAVAAFLSNSIGVGRAPDWVSILSDLSVQPGLNNPFFILVAPLALLDGYFKIYHVGPFFTSVAFGGFLGWRLTRHWRQAQPK